MAGVDVGPQGGAKRAKNSDINMIPFIDLLMVTIAFLLITAEWTRMARIDADAQVPGATGGDTPPPPEKQLHVDMRSADRFVLTWKEGPITIESAEPDDWLSKARKFSRAKVAAEGWTDEDIDRIIKEERKAVQPQNG